MAELRELFEMTTKQMEPDQDSWRKQEERHQRDARRKKIGALAVAAAFAAVAAVGVVWYLDGDEGADGTTPATEGTRPDTAGTGTDVGPETSLVDLRTGTSTPMTSLSEAGGDLDVSPDGTTIAYSDRRIVVADLDGTDVRQFDATRPAVPGVPRWSPDGRTIVYEGGAAGEKIDNLFALDVASGDVTQLTDLGQISRGPWIMSPSYSPDGRSVLFTSPRPCGACASSTGEEDQLVWHLWSVPASGGEPSLVLRDAGFGEYSPDGSTIAYTRVSGDGELGGLWVANADGSDRRQIVDGRFFLPRWSPDGTRIAYYSEREGVWVVDVGTGETTRVADRTGWPEWVDEDTLLIPE